MQKALKNQHLDQKNNGTCSKRSARFRKYYTYWDLRLYICVISNALAKAHFVNVPVNAVASARAGVTPASHDKR